MKKRFKVPVEPKQFVFGRHIFNGNCYMEQKDYEAAVETVNKNSSINLVAATGMIPYLPNDMADIIMRNPVLGVVKHFDSKNNTVDVEIDTKSPAYKFFNHYLRFITQNDATADVEVYGDYKDADGGMKLLKVGMITKFTFFIRKEVLIAETGKISPNDLEKVRIPMFIRRDENDRYNAPNGLYYTKETLLNAYEKEGGVKDMIEGGICPIIVGNPDFNTGMIPFQNVFGTVLEYNIEEGWIEANINKQSVHGQMLLSNKDKIGTELFAGMLMIGDQKKSKILLADQTNAMSKEMDIEQIFGFQLVRKKEDK